MIEVHSIHGEPMYINPDHIETMRVTPDTVLFLNNGKRILIKDTPDEVIDRIVAFRRRIYDKLLSADILVEHSKKE